MTLNILITGSNRGLGLAMAACFLADGHTIFAINRRHSDALQQMQAAHPGRLHLLMGDVADEASIQNALERISGMAGHLDVILNNAAVHVEQPGPAIEQVDFSRYPASFQVNSVGPLIVVKHALPLLRRGRQKLIVNVSSEAGSISASERSSEYAYCMSKAALNMASRILQNSLKPEGIKVLAVHPGWFSSDMGGPNAPMTPAEAADKLVHLLGQSFDLDDPIYLSSDGDVMLW